MQTLNVETSELFQSLSDLTRIRIVRLLVESNQEVCLCEISRSLAEPEYKLSRHIKVLRQVGIIKSVKEGRWVYHSINRGSKPFELLFQLIKSIPDKEKVFAQDQKRFNKNLYLRDNGRCRTENATQPTPN